MASASDQYISTREINAPSMTITRTHTEYARSTSTLSASLAGVKEPSSGHGENDGEQTIVSESSQTATPQATSYNHNNTIPEAPPTMAGVVPGKRKPLPSQSQPLANTRSTSPTNELLSSLLTTTTSSTKTISSYPRPSPPSFLYPQAIVPHQHHRYEATMRTQHPSPNSHSYLGGPEFDLPAIPPGIQMFIYACMVLGFAWALLVWLVNFPPHTWQGSDIKREVKKAPWWRRVVPSLGGRERKEGKRKPFDKPSKYAPVASDEASEGSISSGVTTMGAASAMEMHLMPSSPMVRKRNPQRIRDVVEAPLPLSLGLAPWNQHNRRTEQRAPATIQITHCPPPPTSPENPFLPPPPTLPRSENEYLAAHSAFFSPSRPSSRPSTPSPPSSSSSHFSFEDVDALEAQTELPSQRRVKSEVDLTGKGKAKKKRWSSASWLDVVDGAVNKAVEGLARWTEDAPGEEGLLLPLGREDKMHKE